MGIKLNKYPNGVFFFNLKMTSFVDKSTFLRDMKRFNILLVFLFGLLGCYGQQQDRPALQKSQEGIFYGDAFAVDEVDMKDAVWERYNTMSATDTIALRFKTTVKEVCKVKGCWMVVELPDGEQAMVRFKDYGFFMPSDIPQKEVVLNGLAFVEVMSVEDQRHYATDGGKTAAEIAKISTPKRTYSFEASGVLVPN
ncbi:MAG: DUF4920 domain-containing protein [Maribacter sp.]